MSPVSISMLNDESGILMRNSYVEQERWFETFLQLWDFTSPWARVKSPGSGSSIA